MFRIREDVLHISQATNQRHPDINHRRLLHHQATPENRNIIGRVAFDSAEPFFRRTAPDVGTNRQPIVISAFGFGLLITLLGK